MANSSFFEFCKTAQTIAESRGNNAKIKRCAHYFATLENHDALKLAAQFLGEGAFSSVSGQRASVGYRTVALCASEFCKMDYDLVFRACRQATGSASETIEKLFSNIPEAQKQINPTLPDLKQISLWFEELASLRKKDQKNALIQKIWSQLHPIETKYFIRIMGQGSLRIGFESKSIVSALAKAFNQDLNQVRYVHMITGSLGKTARMCASSTLDHAQFRLFHPLAFMLASPIESRAVDDLSQYKAEEKFDGMRCQVHISGTKAQLFSRDLNDISDSFPELLTFFQGLNLPDSVLDGEICVYKDKTIRPFQELQKRMGVKKPDSKILLKYPVTFIAYDILHWNGESLFEKELMERRKTLEDICQKHKIAFTRQFDVANHEELEQAFDDALSRGNEGLMLKHKNSSYEYGQRKKSWLKVKKPGGSLDTVIMYAHAGSGKRGGTYSDFTLGIRVAEDDRYEEEFIPIGKSYGGYTNQELKKINQEIKIYAVERFGPTLSLKPGIVVEVEFDDIQINRRTKAGYTLRLPRFRAIRWDLSPKDCDSLSVVEKMMEKKLQKNLDISLGKGFIQPGYNTSDPDTHE